MKAPVGAVVNNVPRLRISNAETGEVLAVLDVPAEWLAQPEPEPEVPAWQADLHGLIDNGQYIPEFYGEAVLERLSDVATAEREDDHASLRSQLLRVAVRATWQHRHEVGDPDWMPEPMTGYEDRYVRWWPVLARYAGMPRILAQWAVTLIAHLDAEGDQ